jgi:hypothetical protein
MAEDRYRSDYSRDYGASQDRPDGTHEPASDPLAELARLIGQSDPFADLKQRRASLAQNPQDEVRPAPGWLARGPRDEQSGFAEDPSAEPYQGYRAADPSAPAYDDYAPQPASAYAHDQRYAADERYAPDERYADERQEGAAYEASDRYAAEHHADQHGDARYRVAPPAEYESDEYYDDGHLPPRGEGEGARSAGRRGGLITIAAVLGLAVIGTAGAFGYRAFTGGSSSSTPPIIKADPTPAKSAPATASADTQDKPFQDRVGAPGGVQTERVVPREETPVAQPVPPPTAPWPTTPARVIGPGNATATPPAATTAPAAEPKRVRTVTIKQETGDTTRPTGTVPPAAPATPSRSTATKQPAGAPMAIAPGTPAPDAVTPPARVQTTRIAPPAAATEGAYVVQVSAQRTEGEAQASYRSLQQKYPAVLSGHEASIRRADLGDKGVYYRAQIGPFANAAAANQFCDSLKSAGGQCIVQKN